MTDALSDQNTRPRLALLGPGLILLTLIIMLSWTWGTWPDCIYDFGTQLYVPWQLTTGKHLYTDIAYFNGPFSQYFNAATFEIFGASLRTLVWMNLAIFVGALALLYWLLIQISDRLVATTACIFVILVFGFGQYVGIGNYNWICPYTHEVTHGIAISLAAVAATWQYIRSEKSKWLLLAGFLLGLVFLTKAEVFIPAALAVLVGLIMARKSNRLILLIVTLILPAIIARALGIPPRGIAGSWPWLFNSQIAHLQFYRQSLGIDDISGNLHGMLLSIMSYAVVVTIIFLAAMSKGFWRAIAWPAAALAVITMLMQWQAMANVARPWPLFLLVIAVASIRDRSILRAMLILLALGLLAKMPLNARIAQYGFALAMPAAVLMIEAMLGWGSGWIADRGGSRCVTRLFAIAAIAAVAIAHLRATEMFLGQKNYAVGQGSDRFLADARGVEVQQAAGAIQMLIGPTQTLAVMPQGLMLNYLTRRTNSTPYVNLMPPEVISCGQETIVSALSAHPPDLIALSRKDVAEHGFVLTEGRFVYADEILNWVKLNYQVIGMPPVHDELGLEFLKPEKN